MINAKDIVGTDFPPDEGAHLADELLKRGSLEGLTVDLRELPPSLVISAFFNGFLQFIFGRNPTMLELARRVRWEVKFDFQRENIARWMKDFKPYTEQHA